MTKRITIDELKPGMLVEQLDQSWLTTPFFRHKMTITSPQQIAQLKASGVQSLIVSFDADLVDEPSNPEPDITVHTALPVTETTASVPPTIPFEEELPDARRVYQAAKTIVQTPCMTHGSGERSIWMKSIGSSPT